MVEVLKMTKNLNFLDLSVIRKHFKNRKIGLCHGSFDLIHLGHLNHFKEAKKISDILVVSITSEKFINKGEGRPYNNDYKRIEFLKHLEYIDYVYLENSASATKIIQKLKPNFYFKGIDYEKKDLIGNLKMEKQALKKIKGKLIITKSKKLSSTKIYQKNYSNLKEEQIKQINLISNKYGITKIREKLIRLRKKEITLIGEPIIDKYNFCRILGLTSKDPSISSIVNYSKSFTGGILSNAITASKFVKKVNLITYGQKKHFVKLKKYKNINVVNISPLKEIQIKTRFINENRFEKLFQTSNFQFNEFSNKEQNKILNILKKQKSSLIICDYGIGMFRDKILSLINKIKQKKYINVQINSTNMGINLFTKYNNYHYMCLDEKEWKMGLHKQKISNDDIIKYLDNKKTNFSFTKGKRGSFLYLKEKKFNSPAYASKIIDVTGCGDVYFILSCLLIENEVEGELIVFLANLYAAMYSKFIANSNEIDLEKFLLYIRQLIGD